MKILDQLAVQILREFEISLFFFTGSQDQNTSYLLSGANLVNSPH